MDTVEVPRKSLFRPDEVAQLADLSKRTIYRMVRRGDLVGERKDQGPIRIPRDEVIRLLREEENGA